MLTKATQWVGFYSRPSFCSIFMHVFHCGVLGLKGDQDLPLLCQWWSEASCAPHGGIRSGGKLFGRADFWTQGMGFILLNTSCWKVTYEQRVLPICIPTRASEEKWKKRNHLPWIFMTWDLLGCEMNPTLRSFAGFGPVYWEQECRPALVPQFVLQTLPCLLGAPSVAKTNVIS